MGKSHSASVFVASASPWHQVLVLTRCPYSFHRTKPWFKPRPRFTADGQRLLAVQTIQDEHGAWTEHLYYAKSDRDDKVVEISLKYGGVLKIRPNLIDIRRRTELKKSLSKDPTRFSEYKIQGGLEPRANMQIHKHATMDRDAPQPGYAYRYAHMMGWPMSLFEGAEEFADDMAKVCGIDHWNIGASIVYYRDGNDSMGYHADDDQGEEIICSCLLATPPASRIIKIRVSPKLDKHKKNKGDESFTLYLRAGDAYEMDGTCDSFVVGHIAFISLHCSIVCAYLIHSCLCFASR